MSSSAPFNKKLLAPNYWLTWLGVGLLWLLAWLPWPVQRRIGVGIGALCYHILRQRVDDTRINLRLCFPEKSEAERDAMVRDVFRNAGIGIFETLKAWFRGVDYYRDKASFTGLEHVARAKEQGRGLLILGGHYSTLDLNLTVCAPHVLTDIVYRPQKNPVLNYVMHRGRSGQGEVISHRDMRQLIRAFRENHTVWYAIDQDYGTQHAVFAPFFGIPAATLNTASRFARINNAPVLFIGVRRDGDKEHYLVTFTPTLDNFPSNNDLADATRVNAELEKLIRQVPTQYMWFHRRFKSRPAGEVAPYQRKKKWEKH